jgi:pyruvate/2-oxoglutarate dehydrogenase complex dihydrolipoamide dehydrogenase (E3) component
MTTRPLEADVCVIGAGAAGLTVAAGAAMLGLRAVLFERHEMGGDCLNTGCVPSKAFLAAAKRAHAMRTAGAFGIAAVEPQIDWAGVRAHVRHAIDTIAPVDSQNRFEGLGVTVFREAARFADRRTIESESVRVRARRIVIAAGARPTVPPIPGLADIRFLTSETIWDLEAPPGHLLILGAGPIGLELGQGFRRLGVPVTMIEAGRAMGRADPDLAAIATARLRSEGVRLLEETKAVAARGFTSGRIEVDVLGPEGRDTIEGTHLLLALGRTPNLEGLDLSRGKVRVNDRGIVTDPGLRSVSNPRVWAVGDIAGRGQLTHLAGLHGQSVIRRALFRLPTRVDRTPIPEVTYTEPEIAHIGLREAEARARHGERIRVVRFDFHEIDRAIAERETEGFARMILGPGGRILGCAVAGENAGEIIHLAGLAMANGLRIGAFSKMISPYPTRSEIMKRLASAHFAPLLFSDRTRGLVRLLNELPG